MKNRFQSPVEGSALGSHGILTRDDGARYDLVALRNCDIELCGPWTASARSIVCPRNIWSST